MQESPIKDAIYRYIAASNIREETTRERKFYMSDMGRCLRVRFIKRKGFTSIPKPSSWMFFLLGNAIHDEGYKALEAQGVLLANEEEVETEHFRGRFDGKILARGKPTIFDFKSTSSKNMYRMEKGGSDNEENIMQVLMYAKFDRLVNKEVANAGIIAYINKDPSSQSTETLIHENYYLMNPTREKRLKEDMEKIVDWWLKDKIPPCTCASWASPQYNSFYAICKTTEAKVKKLLNYQEAEAKILGDSEKVWMEKDGKRSEVHI